MALFMNSAQGGMVTADNRELDKPKDATSRLLERRTIVGGMPADRPADGQRGPADRQGRPRAERPDPLLRRDQRAGFRSSPTSCGP